jgi:iron complex outermembrane receptor protein
MSVCALTLLLVASRGHADPFARSLETLLNTPISAVSKYEQTMGEAPASVTVLTSEDFERYGWRTLDEALQTVRGLYISNDRNYAYLGARGFGRPTDYNNRILLLINGHTNNDDFYNSAAIGPTLGLNVDAIERVEVVRAPDSALYGTGAIFAVIDVITKDAGAVDGLHASIEAGSFGRKSLSGMYGADIGGGAELTLSDLWTNVDGSDLYYEEYDDPETNHGRAEGLDWDEAGGVHGTLTAGDFRAQAMFSSRKTGIPTGAFEIAFNDRTASTLDQQAFIELRYATEPNVHTGVMARGYLDYYHYLGVYPYDEDPDFFEQNDSRWGGAEFRLRWDATEYNRLVVGVEAQRHFRVDIDLWDADDTHYLDDGFPFTLLSAYGQNTYQPFENLSLTLGFRSDVYSSDEDSVTPRAAIVYRASAATTVKALYGEAFRVPTRFERFYADEAVFKTNPILASEGVAAAELVWEQRIGSELLGIVSAYRYKMEDLIDEALDPDDELRYFDNISEVDAMGLEAELRAQIGRRGHGYVSYAMRGRATSRRTSA